MSMEPWQMPILVMAVVASPVVIPMMYRLIRDTTPFDEGVPRTPRTSPRQTWYERLTPQKRLTLKTLFWSVMIVVSLVVVVLSFGEQAIQVISTAISSVSTLISTVMAVQNGATLRQVLSIAQGTDEPGARPARDPSPGAATEEPT